MSRFNEPKSPLTSARMFDKKSDAELADWLDTDAQAMDGQPGRNNHVAATRAAAERLRRLAEHDAALIEELADKAEKSFDHAYDFEVDHDQDAYASGYRAGRRSVIRAVFKGTLQARQRREEQS